MGWDLIKSAGGGAATPVANIILVEGGNTLPAPFSVSGILRSSTEPVLPNGGYDLSSLPTMVDGLGYGRVLFGPGVGNRVIIMNAPPATIVWDLIAGFKISSFSTATLTSPDTLTTATVYIPNRIA